MNTKVRHLIIVFFLFNVQLYCLSQNTDYTCNEIVTKSLKSIKEIKSSNTIEDYLKKIKYSK